MLAEGVDGRYAVVDMEKGKGMKEEGSFRVVEGSRRAEQSAADARGGEFWMLLRALG